jgi:hypothetical protein
VVELELTPLRFDTTPMSSEVHGNGLGTKAKPLVLRMAGGFAVCAAARRRRGVAGTCGKIRKTSKFCPAIFVKASHSYRHRTARCRDRTHGTYGKKAKPPR